MHLYNVGTIVKKVTFFKQFISIHIITRTHSKTHRLAFDLLSPLHLFSLKEKDLRVKRFE